MQEALCYLVALTVQDAAGISSCPVILDPADCRAGPSLQLTFGQNNLECSFSRRATCYCLLGLLFS
jgi:hypothetical protein